MGYKETFDLWHNIIMCLIAMSTSTKQYKKSNLKS